MQGYEGDIPDIIRKRVSWRTYSSIPVEEEKISSLIEFSKGLKGPFGGKARFKVIRAEELGSGSIKTLGTYGTIKGANLYLVGMIEEFDHDMEEFGYLFEKLILKATSLELGTCWIGGVFMRGVFAEKAGLRDNEVLPAISPLGYPAQKRSITDSVVRFSAGSRNRKPWNEIFFHGDFTHPLTQEDASAYSLSLEMLRLAPSASNRQPWRIVKERGREIFHFYLRRSPGYDKIIKAVDLQRIDMGIAMSHFDLTNSWLGISGRWVKESSDPLNIVLERTEYFISWIRES